MEIGAALFAQKGENTRKRRPNKENARRRNQTEENTRKSRRLPLSDLRILPLSRAIPLRRFPNLPNYPLSGFPIYPFAILAPLPFVPLPILPIYAPYMFSRFYYSRGVKNITPLPVSQFTNFTNLALLTASPFYRLYKFIASICLGILPILSFLAPTGLPL